MKRAKILFIAGLIMIITGAGLYYLSSRQTAKAATTYNIDYKMTKCRLVGIKGTPGDSNEAWVFVGPAEWTATVTGGYNATETWEVKNGAGNPNWIDTMGTTDVNPLYATTLDENDNRCNNFGAQTGWNPGLGWKWWADVKTIALYGAIIDVYQPNAYTGISSIPKSWKITGTVQ